jgi:hypothetical protein
MNLYGIYSKLLTKPNRMKTELIKVIEKTIDVLENNKTSFDWTRSSHCNCGLIAQQVCSLDEIQHCLISVRETLWTGRARNQCSKTGNDLHIVFKKLFDIGLTVSDIICLEKLTDKNVLSRFDKAPIFDDNDVLRTKTNRKINDKDYLIQYLKSWREILLEEGGEVKVEQPETIRYVTVEIDSKLKESIKKDLILS